MISRASYLGSAPTKSICPCSTWENQSFRHGSWEAATALDLHLRSIRELCRVAREVYIFPIMELGARRSRHVDVVASTLAGQCYAVEIRRVDYEFQKGGNEMMSISRPGR